MRPKKGYWRIAFRLNFINIRLILVRCRKRKLRTRWHADLLELRVPASELRLQCFAKNFPIQWYFGIYTWRGGLFADLSWLPSSCCLPSAKCEMHSLLERKVTFCWRRVQLILIRTSRWKRWFITVACSILTGDREYNEIISQLCNVTI